MNTHTHLNLNNLWDLLRLTGFNLLPAQQIQICFTDDDYVGDPTEDIASYQAAETPAASLPPYPEPAGLRT